ncbi:MAG: alkaline phosphatase family protein [Planctomycetes bacterium]|nr:alkaline phosphatase family protein [Planctomycetota bacterium]
MKRICVIEIAGLSCRLAGRNAGLWVNSLPTPPRPMLATFPAVGPSIQASMTTGVEPGKHGVISGGLYRRESMTLSFDERSNTLLNKKRFWHSRKLPGRPRTAMLFCYNSLAGAADLMLGITTYGPSNGLLTDQPRGLYDELAAKIGQFNSRDYNGPDATWRAGGWISAAAGEIWLAHKPDLLWVYLPGINFEAVRGGADSPQAGQALVEVDKIAAGLGLTVLESGSQAIIVSNGGMTDVRMVCLPNQLLRAAGLLEVVQTAEGEMPDLARSRAFAMTDHQVAYLYCRDEQSVQDAQKVLGEALGVAGIFRPEEKFCAGAGRYRAGSRVILARPDCWFAYPWWKSPDRAPVLAGRLDVPGKIGHDPCEVFGSGQQGGIDPDAARVRASRGLVSCDAADQCVLAATCPLDLPAEIRATDVPAVLQGVMFESAAVPSRCRA